MFVARLRMAIKARGISQREIERRAGLASGVISRWLSGKYVPTLDAAVEVADLFPGGVTLFFGTETEREMEVRRK